MKGPRQVNYPCDMWLWSPVRSNPQGEASKCEPASRSASESDSASLHKQCLVSPPDVVKPNRMRADASGGPERPEVDSDVAGNPSLRFGRRGGEGEQWIRSEKGTPQGGAISPLAGEPVSALVR